MESKVYTSLLGLLVKEGICMHEDKHIICNLLLFTLQETRGLGNLISLDYDENKELVVAKFSNRVDEVINVSMDSGIAMVNDIIKVLTE